MAGQVNNLEDIPAEYGVYLHPDFDAELFANSVLNNEPYHSISGSATQNLSAGDVGLALSKLNIGIEDITKRLRSEVSTHHLELLSKASSIASLHDSLQSTKIGLKQIETNVERLQKKIGARYTMLEESLNHLDRYQDAAELCRRVVRFVSLSRRLEGQMAELELKSSLGSTQASQVELQTGKVKELVLAEAAFSISELEKLLEVELETVAPNALADQQKITNRTAAAMSSLRAIQPHILAVLTARKKVENEMNKMLMDGLVLLDRTLLASSFQTAYNLSILDKSVSSLVLDLAEVVQNRIKMAFDINSLARDAGTQETSTASGFSYKSRARTEPSPGAVPHWTNLLWTKLGGLIDDLTSCCVKVYTLEQVLEWKKDSSKGLNFLEIVISGNTTLEKRPRTVFWDTLCSAIEKEVTEAARASNFINQTLTTSYPHLLRLFHDFFSRISLHTHTTYNQLIQSLEMVMTLRAVSLLESSYLNRSTNKMSEASNGRPENFAAVLGNELDAARFDPLLVKSVARQVREVTENYFQRLDSRIATQYQNTYLSGPVVTQAQIKNLEIFNSLQQVALTLSNFLSEYNEEIKVIIQPSIRLANEVMDKIFKPLQLSIKRELSMTLSKMHGVRVSAGSGSSLYMQELSSKLNFIRQELLLRLKIEARESLLVETTQYLLRSFLLHASLMTPLTEFTKLRLASDLVQLEFEITQFLSSSEENSELEDDFESMRNFRQLIFMDDYKQIEELIMIGSIEELVILHHLIVRDHIKLPHQINQWSEAEYVRWVEEHPVKSDRIKLINESLSKNLSINNYGNDNDDQKANFQPSIWTLLTLKFINRIKS
ncbi:Golgi transport complex subunit 5-domain-containing protein [Phakopsora pachyrhizi]|uniref:Conserved oligomeric Golgi complex subunit 5 n=1 Tax=Phakopsora pachyrhizi TaxID=170000 RepID=A0AAV0B6N0_PHAPC|nr:Golgi transport complex subunit 5-domain-containing protein [Phakopsora pachyrhizi]